MPGLVTDTLRLLRDFVWWNTRKSLYHARGGHGSCPCQVASDSGRAFETGCEAATPYVDASRFRLVCPLLVKANDGRSWVCSVSAPNVRPFWGRAVLGLATAGIITFLVLGMVIFGTLRGIGYELTPRQVFWPPAWHEFRQVQAEFHKSRAARAQADGRLTDALLHLANAYELAPLDYATGMRLALLYQTTQPLLSDQTYARLYRDHPDLREETARAWLRALLARGDFLAVFRLSADRLLGLGTQAAPAWRQALLFAARQSGDPAVLQPLLNHSELSEPDRTLLRAERELYALNASERVVRLRALATSADQAFPAYHWCSHLLAENRPDLVLSILRSATSPLETRERLRLLIDTLAASGRQAEHDALARTLLEQPLTKSSAELLAAHLILYPNHPLLAKLIKKASAPEFSLPDDAAYPLWLSLFAAAAAQPEERLMLECNERLNALAGRKYRALEAVRLQFPRLIAGEGRLDSILPVLQPMPLEIVYALYARFSPPPPLPP